MVDGTLQPGAAWLEIVRRPTLQEFSCAFSADPTLEATYLEWDGVFQGKGVSGVTILTDGAQHAIERIRLFHYPYEQQTAFSVELVRRHSLKTESFNTLSGVLHENER